MAEEQTQPLEGEIVTQPPPMQVTKQDENIVLNLEAAFNNGYNITEACQFAGISRKTFYKWLGDDDAFSYRMSVAQTALNRKAKTNVMAAIQSGDPGISLRYLTLRDPDFKPKTVVEPPPELNETREKLKDFFDDIKRHDPSSELAAADTPDSGDEISQAPTDIS